MGKGRETRRREGSGLRKSGKKRKRKETKKNGDTEKVDEKWKGGEERKRILEVIWRKMLPSPDL
jgi:hypothetical protein